MREVMHGMRLAGLVVQTLFVVALAGVAAILAGYTAAAALGYAGWLHHPVQIGDAPAQDLGRHVQIGLAMLAVGLLSYLPANRRILALETSHRQFSLHMHDVTRAYAQVHAADRDGVFTLSHEFDAVKERIAWLRDHPDLSLLEPDVLEVAAQMSVISRDLAVVYSSDKVARARAFLTQRQEEIATFETRLAEAKAVATDIRRWAARVELDEDVARSEIARLREMLAEILPEILPEIDPPAPMRRRAGRPIAALPMPDAAE